MARIGTDVAIALTVPLVVISAGVVMAQPAQPRGLDELRKLIPHIKEACAPVLDAPGLWPLRVFPYGPLSLEARKASPTEAGDLRNFHLGVAAAACGVPSEAVTSHFFCGPECPKNRRDHLVSQLTKVRAAVSRFESLRGVNLVSIWAPRGEIRVNDVFVLGKTVEEAIPSPVMGLVPSGQWRAWSGLASYLATIRVEESDIRGLDSSMREIGLSAFVREKTQVRAVGVGLGDNESGLLFLGNGGVKPVVGKTRPDGSRYQFVEEVSKGVFFYETT